MGTHASQMAMFLSSTVINSEALPGETPAFLSFKAAFECVVICHKLIQAK